jgi:coproporphyrinogen III oxidase
LKKPTGSIRFRFYKSETEKTKPSRTQTKKTEPNWSESVFVLKHRTEPKPVGFFLNFNLVTLFLYKNQIGSKMITPTL